jgi:hypothetical protein
MIPEPQRTYVLELLKALGPAGDEFVVAGTQAMKFALDGARATKDIDFVLDVVGLRGEKLALGPRLKELGYTVVESSQNFQFEKRIPNSTEIIRIEFMAPEEFKRDKDFRVDIDKGIHARACTGGSIAVAESAVHELSGKLPDGTAFVGRIRVTKPHALVMLKLLALDDRYKNIRGSAEARHDREEAGTHSADIIAIATAQGNPGQFRRDIAHQFRSDVVLGVRVLNIQRQYFAELTSPGFLVYEEFIVADKPIDREVRRAVSEELNRVHQTMIGLLPAKEFYELLGAVDDSCDIERNPGLVEEFLSNLEKTRTSLTDRSAIERIPGSAFGGAFKKGETFTTNAGSALKAVSAEEWQILSAYVDHCGNKLRGQAELTKRFSVALAVKAKPV